MSTTSTITNPKTKRNVKVRVWTLKSQAIRDGFKDGTFKTAKDLSWALLNDKNSLQAMEREEGGDSASNNYALSVLEGALDWGLGLAVVRLFKDFVDIKRRVPETFKLAATRKGDVFVILKGKSGEDVVMQYV